MITEEGYLGAVPQNSAVGDWMCMLRGGRHLYVVRDIDELREFKYVGHAYVHGLMHGEVLEGGEYVDRVITLV